MQPKLSLARDHSATGRSAPGAEHPRWFSIPCRAELGFRALFQEVLKLNPPANPKGTVTMVSGSSPPVISRSRMNRRTSGLIGSSKAPRGNKRRCKFSGEAGFVDSQDPLHVQRDWWSRSSAGFLSSQLWPKRMAQGAMIGRSHMHDMIGRSQEDL